MSLISIPNDNFTAKRKDMKKDTKVENHQQNERGKSHKKLIIIKCKTKVVETKSKDFLYFPSRKTKTIELIIPPNNSPKIVVNPIFVENLKTAKFVICSVENGIFKIKSKIKANEKYEK